jgi:hypothetical protein
VFQGVSKASVFPKPGKSGTIMRKSGLFSVIFWATSTHLSEFDPHPCKISKVFFSEIMPFLPAVSPPQTLIKVFIFLIKIFIVHHLYFIKKI